MRYYVSIFTKPAVPRHFEQVCSLSRIRNQYPSQEVARVRSNVFWKGQWSRDDVFVQEINVVSFGICWIVIERQISSQHGVLKGILDSLPDSDGIEKTHQNDAAAPDIHFSSRVQ